MTIRKCADCGKKQKHHARGKCRKCYMKRKSKIYYHKNKKVINKRKRERYHTDPEYRKKCKEASRIWLKKRKEAKERVIPSYSKRWKQEHHFARCIPLMCGADEEEFLKAYKIGRFAGGKK